MKKPIKTKWSHPDDVTARWIDTAVGALVAKHHDHLEDAEIAVIFCEELPARNGRRILGTAHVMSEKERLLTAVDLLICLDKRAWKVMGGDTRRAVLDHELCHFGMRVDEDGTPERDDKGRTMYRLNAHDVEEFLRVIKRHGTYLADIAATAAALRDSPSAAQLGIAWSEDELKESNRE